ncbi:hydroxymethylbilane synthase [Streptomyces sp. NPDC054835]|uniref:hydroxymethylbilane synthase n=1 Tax=Streptomyces exfoliatus TaxID=1905 RepID=UPI000464296E|nr:hydroxymethylbilane synthase [Streptomyces exfoliatus]
MTTSFTPSRVVIGTRSSAMAMAQTAHVAALLRRAHPGLAVHVAQIVTTADKHKGPLDSVGGKQAWVRELDLALGALRADLTVSCAKDLPGEHERGTAAVIGAVLPRDDARDALVLPLGAAPASLRDLPAGSVVGTIAPRRAAQLRAQFPHLEVAPLRGNLDTRISRLDEGSGERLDALVVSYAGLQRLGLVERAVDVLAPDSFLPATGAGFVVVEHRAGDRVAEGLLHAISDPRAERLLRVERGVLGKLGGDCYTACSVHAAFDAAGQLTVAAGVFSPDGWSVIKTHAISTAEDDQETVDRMVATLKREGAEALLLQARPARGN